MITLATLPLASAQEVFDHVVNHARTQRKPSVGKILTEHGSIDSCLYRSSEGLSCFAGCLMSDEEYNPRFEDTSWDSLIEDRRVPPTHRRLIGYLQMVHDKSTYTYMTAKPQPSEETILNDWEEGFWNVARKFNLTYTPSSK